MQSYRYIAYLKKTWLGNRKTMRNADRLCCVIECDLSIESIEPVHKIGHEMNQAVTEQFGNSAENILDSIWVNLDRWNDK